MAPLIETTPRAIRMSYRIGRGEQGVLTFEPYKSALLPLWRFRTVPIARKSAADLWQRFEEFDAQEDFVGMDMSRKFIQMGMTRAKRYANHAGGRKYKKGTKEELPKSETHEGKGEKEAASMVFREVWERCKAHERYQRRKEDFLAEQRSWEKSHVKQTGGGDVNEEMRSCS
ncbi:hypothetical protein BKA67DRAFT_659688 [Truncatella angustata]|uniref:DUF4385 domain containing protein n=1 Tax=Truncatella angustata TaxID=152316 RepID=A0A9P8ZWK3_9PEZI|nr:uncharacterized protein BKA67DRAFT_659688 [Truncatella angustata]KAH6653042.1 hypothetical protein BKA67DRAFT_659688 [Truncatella angustata]KAH8194981.1 hypothetical protein TruAng_010852 [Truncatella angustata]